MNDFSLWFITGIQHILDLDGADHILFVSLLVLATPLDKWRSLLLLVTGFTAGHCLSLAFSVIKSPPIHQPLIELLIALSIMVTAVMQLVYSLKQKAPPLISTLLAVIFFGLIHGLGFSFILRSMLGTMENRILPLLYFNVGIEAGQLIIVIVVGLFSLLLASLFKLRHQTIQLFTVCCIALVALKMSAERLLQHL
jgi:hypothetical protein